ncbi:unnamed protein product [Porites lobata]|uniref:Uncharacterized protein n=1 Tax=Porites lobata TaxID=104759 RepID=A0ABN8QUJ1_9CNID|nr:unnamed protein product [Porites lobata]
MGNILESKQLGDEEKAKLYNQVLQRYLTYYDQRKGQPLHVKLTAPKTTETPKPAENAESTEEASPDNSLPTALGLDSCWIKLKNTRMCCTGMLYENKPIPGSHVVDLVNDTLRHRKGFEPVGWSVFARGLARMNVPENLVRNPQRQSAIREFKARVREETPESPSRWLPTPPVTLSSVKKQRRRV